ncbi:hypothetical protein [Endozoicomonas sp. YOMI1]|uniref:hypothetical protein n=1 Tax=Endozoicomonas sp. YOMI1 TaxID=2828739 RepID=UPI002147AFA6|nr:hypothetical protein [Endozoicomonas sp. YOMI1]
MQGFILKSTASHNSRLKLAGRIDRQADSNGIPDRNRNAFNGKRVSNRQFHGSTAATLNDGNRFEDAFWKKRPLQGRQITSADVLSAYVNDRTSLGSGFFLQKLCLKNMLHDNRKVTPDQVIQEFNRKPDRSNKYKLAIARFKAECCLRRLPLNGLQVTPDAVVKDFPDSQEGKLGIARFKAECCLRGLPLNGQQVTSDAVVNDFPESSDGKLSKARFTAECCLRGLRLNGWQVTPEAVIKDFERGGWLLERAIFYSQLAMNARVLHGSYLDNQKVLAAFNKVPGDHSSRQAEYLMQRLKQPQWYDETNEARDIFKRPGKS